jgi:hypothetical protein
MVERVLWSGVELMPSGHLEEREREREREREGGREGEGEREIPAKACPL